RYILSIESAEEIEEYIGDLIQGTDGKKRQFIDELLERWQRSRQRAPESVQLYRRNEEIDTEVSETMMGCDALKKSKRKGRNKQETMIYTEQAPGPEEVKTPIDLAKAQESSPSSSSSSSFKKKKFVSLYAKEGQDKLAILLPGRHPCECLAQKHKLINNCLTCGRIVCEQEGSGPCLFCGSLVCTKEEQEILQRDSNKSQKLRKKLMAGVERGCEGSEKDVLPHEEARMQAGLEKALQHKDKLLEFDKNRLAQESSPSSSSFKKKKFVSLYAKEGQDKLAIILPGRHPCECLAQKHKLINNCLTCGRIVCEQEGSGPCLFCGSLVCTKEQEILQRDSNKSQKLRKKLMADQILSDTGSARLVHLVELTVPWENAVDEAYERKKLRFPYMCGPCCVSGVERGCEGSEKDVLPHEEARMQAGLEKALQHKDKLLEFDKNSVRRTKVIDDQSDYFSADSNQWLSQAEREALRKRGEELRELCHASRQGRKITFDFTGRQILEEGEKMTEYYSKFDDTVHALNTGSLGQSPKPADRGPRQHLRELVNPNIIQAAPVWVDLNDPAPLRKPQSSQLKGSRSDPSAERTRLRIQDKELQEIADDGWCLSMHQPWASLLIKGIKRVEGRTWYSSHRGRLWIAAAGKRPTPQEISQVEASYRTMYKRVPEFPKEYSTGCLLGCENMADCLSQEQFREQFQETCEESASPFVFICSNPQELVVKFPMKGKHKICSAHRYHPCTESGGAKMNTRCPPKRVPSAARFFTLCRLTVQQPQSYSVGGQRSSGAAYRQARRRLARLQGSLVRDTVEVPAVRRPVTCSNHKGFLFFLKLLFSKKVAYHFSSLFKVSKAVSWVNAPIRCRIQTAFPPSSL
ncbi:UNVERIFIED_CONTAM: hypothetical protein FKN15_028745, partial [Acipenser sinensis]